MNELKVKDLIKCTEGKLILGKEEEICDDFSKVVNILSQADQEITLQKQKLQKLIAQRKALMQVLLTGIVRV